MTVSRQLSCPVIIIVAEQATKILEYEVSVEGPLANLIAFNMGVELGQLMALGRIVIAMGYQLTGYFVA